MADTGGKRYGDGCAGGERGGATTARAVYTEVLQVVHGIAVGNPRAGYWTLRYWTASPIGRPEGLRAIGRPSDQISDSVSTPYILHSTPKNRPPRRFFLHMKAPIVGYKMYNIDCNLLFSYKISRFTCVCAFFVVLRTLPWLKPIPP